MDFASLHPEILAKQLLKPEGELGEQVGEAMAERHVKAMAWTFEHLHVEPTDHVLEIGFGPGEGIAEAARLTPKGYVAGIDFSETMLQMAENRNHDAIMQERVELTLGEAAKLPYPDESFDKLFAMNVFHFWQKPQQELLECLRVLKSGGRLVFYTTHHSAWVKGVSETGIFLAYEPEQVEKILTDAGFRDVKSQTSVLNERKCFIVTGIK